MNGRQAGMAALIAAAMAALIRIATAYMDPALQKAVVFSGLGVC